MILSFLSSINESKVYIEEWVKKNRPEEYKRMQEGYEIGFSKSKDEYYKNN